MSTEISHAAIMEKIGHLEERCNQGCGKKYFPAGVLLAIAIQTTGVVWWASSIDSDLEHAKIIMHDSVNKNTVKSLIDELTSPRHLDMSTRMARVEQNYEHLVKTMERIEIKLDKKLE